MAFIDKKDPVVLNIKLTSQGRELLSKGKLTFNYFGVGDSEIDYDFNRDAGFNPFNSNVLRPADKNPLQLSFISRNFDDDIYNSISAVPCTPTIVENHVPAIGFFDQTATEFLSDTDHVKQPDGMIVVSAVTGGNLLTINKAPTYQANPNEPSVGDFLLVRWANPKTESTTGYTVNINLAVPYIWYSVQSIVSGSLSSNNLVIEVDRELPDFGNLTGATDNGVVAGAMFYYNSIKYDGDDSYSTDDTDDALIAFLQNCQCPTIKFPFWNMSLIYTENIIGVDPTKDKSLGEYRSSSFGGFVSYIQNQAKDSDSYKKKLGVIHYTNNSVANVYAEGFYGDPLNSEDEDKVPTLDIPTVMWHKSSGTTLGVRFKASGGLKYLVGDTKSLNTRYFDLADSDGNVVGKVFYDLKVFVIEDQELLFALSYKSNRSWTLPNYGVDINANVTFGCPQCSLDYTATTISPNFIGGDEGSIIVSDIINVLGDPLHGELILEVLSGTEQVFFNKITGDTTITNDNTLNGFRLSAAIYTVKMTDLGAPNCTTEYDVDLTGNTSTLITSSNDETYSALIPYFQVDAWEDNPVRIRLFSDTSIGLGFPFGTAYVTVGPTGMTQSNLSTRFANGVGVTGNDAISSVVSGGKWTPVPDGGFLEITNLSFRESYAIYVRDSILGDFSEINDPTVINSQTWTYYVAAATPFKLKSEFVLTQGSDSTGQYVVVSDYIRAIDINKNPIVGEIESALHSVDNDPTNWVASQNDGTPIKMYLPNNASGDYNVTVRERDGYVQMYSVKADNTINI